jgi:2-keto-4-pentenoate hydratase/2-oxohepta-3-ene-1,7-dioic acid hydratase in catechol pathway
MRLVTFQPPHGHPQAGILSDGKIQATGTDMLSICAAGRAHPQAGASFDLASVKLLAPIPRPPKFICVGLNYRDHAAEAKMEVPTVPTIFNKFPSVVIGPGDAIVFRAFPPSPTTKPNSLS